MNRTRSTVLIGTGVGLAALGAVGVVSGCDMFADLGPVTQAASDYQVTQPVGLLAINDPGGGVTVSASPSAKTVSVTENQHYQGGGKPVSTHAVSAGTLTLGYTCPSDGDCGISYTVTIPTDVSVNITDSAGEIDLHGIGGTVQVQDSAGAIQADDLTAAQVTLNDSAGDISAHFATAPAYVEAQDTAGSVLLAVPGTATYAVSASSSAGDATVDVMQAAGSKHVIKATSSAGDVQVVPGGSAG